MPPAAPKIVGIVNVTEDSFSDGGRYLEPERAYARCLELVADGADVIELGAASSNPDAKCVPAEEEIRRLDPLLARLVENEIPVAVDSSAPETHAFALARGTSLLNDVRGFPDPARYPELARARARLVVMHAVQGATRAPTDPETILERVLLFFDSRVAALERAGVARDRLILDPGMGFFLGGNCEPSLVVLRSLGSLRARFGLPLLISVSRKSFLGALTGRAVQERGAATLAAELFAAAQGVDFIRTHDVRALVDALRVSSALAGEAPVGTGAGERRR